MILDRRARRHPATILGLWAEGFALNIGAESRAVAWSEVEEIVAFKRDLYTTDCICLALAMPGGTVEINEEMPGFVDWREAMEHHFGLTPDWYIEIMTPVFEPTPLRLFPTAPAP